MKRILSLILVLTCIFSSFTFLANAEENTEASTEASTETNTGHVHERNPYLVFYTETKHRYSCTTCNEYCVEDHIPEEEGKCPCGYFDHEHTPEAWAMVDVSGEKGLTAHSYLCSECSNAAIIIEEHAFDENGFCRCGYVDSENENINSFTILRVLLFEYFPKGIRFITKFVGKAFDVLFDDIDSTLYYYKVLAYLIAFGI